MQAAEGWDIRYSIECWLVGDVAATPVKVLLLHTAPDKNGFQFWQPVTGGIVGGETPEQACHREVHEETQIELPAGILRRFGALDLPIPDHRWVLSKTIFVARVPEISATLSDEHSQAMWFLPSEVDRILYWEGNRTVFAELRNALGI